MSVFMTAGDVEKWKDTPPGEKRLLLGRRLAQVCACVHVCMWVGVFLWVCVGVGVVLVGMGGIRVCAGMEEVPGYLFCCF